MKKIVAGLIKLYQKRISVRLLHVCRFYPSCSQYALEAVEKHGAVKGLYLSARRLLRCHPYSKGGYDPLK